MSTLPITQTVNAWLAGDNEALEKVFPLLYGDLKYYAKTWSHDHSSDSYVNRGMIRLIELRSGKTFKSRKEFFAFWSKVMKHLRIDDFRKANRDKRTPYTPKTTARDNLPDHELDAEGNPRMTALPQDQAVPPLDECSASEGMADVLLMERAMAALKAQDARAYRVASMRINGFLHRDIAQEIGRDEGTARKIYADAKAFLKTYLQEH